jgi:hypothetical protein
MSRMGGLRVVLAALVLASSAFFIISCMLRWSCLAMTLVARCASLVVVRRIEARIFSLNFIVLPLRSEGDYEFVESLSGSGSPGLS